MASFDIKAYEIGITNCASPYAWIMLYDSDPSSTATYRARLYFRKLRETTTYSMSESGPVITVYMNYTTFASVVDLLRNEKPLNFYWYTASQFCGISSSPEPVGEEERTHGIA